MEDVKIEGPEGEDRKRNIRIGCGVVALGVITIPAIIIGIPLVAALYRWAFGG